MTMNRGFGLAGCSRTECDQRDAIARGSDIGELSGVRCQRWRELRGADVVVKHDGLKHGGGTSCLVEFCCVLSSAKRVLDLSFDGNGSQFLSAELWHGGYSNASRFENGKPACRQHGSVGVA